MKLFVTSNQQFGRPGAINTYSRSFENVDEMDNYMINQWNSVVSDEDTVFVLGNFSWQPEQTEEILEILNGKIYVIPGEWDRATYDVVKTKGDGKLHYLPDAIRHLPTINSVFSYWPLVDWPKKKSGSVSFFGHPGKSYKTDHKKGIVNVACDRWDFKPVLANDIVKLYNDPDLKKSKK